MKERTEALALADRLYYDSGGHLIKDRVAASARLQAPRRRVDWQGVAGAATGLLLAAMFWGAVLFNIGRWLGWWGQ
jgi:hypothetical protein